MQIAVVSLFPEFVEQVGQFGVVGRANDPNGTLTMHKQDTMMSPKIRVVVKVDKRLPKLRIQSRQP